MSQTSSITKTIRFTPREIFTVDLAARVQRRSLSSFVAMSATTAAALVELPAGPSIGDLIADLWHVDPDERLKRIHKFDPSLLTYEEEIRLQSLINDA